MWIKSLNLKQYDFICISEKKLIKIFNSMGKKNMQKFISNYKFSVYAQLLYFVIVSLSHKKTRHQELEIKIVDRSTIMHARTHNNTASMEVYVLIDLNEFTELILFVVNVAS